jgi:hypothetical protein
MNEKIFVFQRKENGKIEKIEEYDNPAHFAVHYFEQKVTSQFGDSDTQRVPRWEFKTHFFESDNVFAKVAFNSKEKIIPVSQLVGYVRERKNIILDEFYSSFYRRGRKSAYGRFRKPKTTQERRWSCAWDDEEFAPKIRKRRKGHNLPNAWDDYISHNEKSWKRQSKRKHQWG